MPKNDHDFIMEFIEIYKMSPCLWNKTDPHYHTTNIKEAAYTLLLHKYQEYNEKATLAMVKSKINNLRSTFGKELRKVKDSERSWSESGELYKPSLWYYDLLSFVSDQHLAWTSIHNMDDDDENLEADDSQSISDKDGADDDCSTQGQLSDQEFTRPSPSQSSYSTRRKRSAIRSKKEVHSKKKVLQFVTKRFKKTNDVRVWKHDSFGKHIADELNNMAPAMVPYVKKIINLAIFEGHMKTLNISSAIITQQVSGKFPISQAPESHFLTPQSSQGYYS